MLASRVVSSVIMHISPAGVFRVRVESRGPKRARRHKDAAAPNARFVSGRLYIRVYGTAAPRRGGSSRGAFLLGLTPATFEGVSNAGDPDTCFHQGDYPTSPSYTRNVAVLHA